MTNLDPDIFSLLEDAFLKARNLSSHANLDIQTGDLISLDSHEVDYMKSIVHRLLDLAIVYPARNSISKATIGQKVLSKQK